MVGLSGVVITSLARIHDEDLPGDAVLRTFSSSYSTFLLDMWLIVPNLELLTHTQHLSVELMDLCLTRGLLRVDAAIGVLEAPVVLQLACEILG